ncbi:MAG: NAD(P)/FAD-dependent oxidoreductase [Clostridia bacterium]|nr:NAD(P)/FAD-dependent oxidoreductase [Clostridia bacterium]
MYDIIIIGAGPAGISASLYCKRAGMKVLVLYHGTSELQKAYKIDNYYGFPEGITGEELYNNGINQAKKLGVEVLEKEVTNIEIEDNLCFNVKTINESFEAKAIIIATGNKKVRPNIEGVEEFEGKGISYCAICDGFFYRNKNVAIIGNGEFAISEAKDLENVVNNILILTNGNEAPIIDKYKTDIRKIRKINGNEKVDSIEFEDGEKIDIDGIFVAEGIAGGASFAKKLGIITKGDNIEVNRNMETNIPGIFACGNLTGGLLQINKAVYEGAKAGLQAVNYIKNKEE